MGYSLRIIAKIQGLQYSYTEHKPSLLRAQTLALERAVHRDTYIA